MSHDPDNINLPEMPLPPELPADDELPRWNLTAPEVKVLTETASKVAYALGRKDAGEEIAVALERCEDDARRAEQKTHKEVWFHLAAGYMRSAELAREVASRPSQAASDATSGVPGHQEVSEAVRSPQEPCEDPDCPTPLMHTHSWLNATEGNTQ